MSQPPQSVCIWTARQLLVFPDVTPGARYTLPFFAHNSLGSFLLCDQQGKALLACEDASYQAPDHSLLWVDYRGLEHVESEERPVILAYLYFSSGSNESQTHLAEACKGDDLVATSGPVASLEQVFLFTDYFREKLSKWKVQAGTPKEVLIRPRPSSCATLAPGGCLELKPRGGAVVVQHSISLQFPHGRLHLRAHFSDSGNAKTPSEEVWVGLWSRLGSACVGLSASSPEHYSVLVGKGPDAGSGWQRTTVPRGTRWHLFEITFENGHCSIFVDHTMVTSVRACDRHVQEEVLIGASSSKGGVWGASSSCTRPSARAPGRWGCSSCSPATAGHGACARRRQGIGRWRPRGTSARARTLPRLPHLRSSARWSCPRSWRKLTIWKRTIHNYRRLRLPRRGRRHPSSNRPQSRRSSFRLERRSRWSVGRWLKTRRPWYAWTGC
mmetsp:Transcript_131717/g.421437  ORF Transcript_131717/g.421437 Transcript_131717/m.421437 type:complete len:441 (+) Transcript_131717:85-1407(+)